MSMKSASHSDDNCPSIVEVVELRTFHSRFLGRSFASLHAGCCPPLCLSCRHYVSRAAQPAVHLHGDVRVPRRAVVPLFPASDRRFLRCASFPPAPRSCSPPAVASPHLRPLLHLVVGIALQSSAPLRSSRRRPPRRVAESAAAPGAGRRVWRSHPVCDDTGGPAPLAWKGAAARTTADRRPERRRQTAFSCESLPVAHCVWLCAPDPSSGPRPPSSAQISYSLLLPSPLLLSVPDPPPCSLWPPPHAVTHPRSQEPRYQQWQQRRCSRWPPALPAAASACHPPPPARTIPAVR